MNKCIIYIRTKDLSEWNDYMWKLRTNEPTLPPSFRTIIDGEKEKYDSIWIQMTINIDDLIRIYDLMDEFATIAEKYNEK